MCIYVISVLGHGSRILRAFQVTSLQGLGLKFPNVLDSTDFNELKISEQFRQHRLLNIIAAISAPCDDAADGAPQFHCPGSNQCIDEHHLCNGARDCPGGQDENPTACLFHHLVRFLSMFVPTSSMLHGRSGFIEQPSCRVNRPSARLCQLYGRCFGCRNNTGRTRIRTKR